MYTQCPHCQTCFRVSEAHLKAAGGRVRCGSCQEVFDATQRLYNNLTDKQPIKRSKEDKPTRKVETLPEHETEHIDLSATPAPASPAVEAIRQKRKHAPDQSRYMQSVVDNDRYNNLDNMQSISIPGTLDFGDSFIQHPPEEPAQEPPAAAPQSSSPYEDTESKRIPTSDADRASIASLFADADSQLQADEQQSQLDRDIDELLAFANANDLDRDSDTDITIKDTKAKPAADDDDEFDIDDIAAFEAELAASEPVVEPEEDVVEIAATPVIELPPTDSIEKELPSPDEDIPRALRRSLDSLNAMPTRSLGQTLGLLGMIVLLLGALGFQLLLFRNVELVRIFPALTPMVSSACGQLPCQYAGEADVRQIKLLNRDVRSHPTQNNALLISAAFVNEAAFDQPYPTILITLSDLSGHVVASRRFSPQEYLEDMYNRFILLESGTPVHVTLAVLDPGSDAINFEFSFL